MATVTRLNTREFDRTLRQYMKVTSRDLATVLNTKAFFIARRATVETHKASAQEIKSELGRVIRRKNKPNRLRLAHGREHDAPLAALIINARRGRAGLPGLFGKAMSQAIEALLVARMRSIAFLKSGWLPAIRKLAPFADRRGTPRQDRSAKQVGREKGTAIPAKPGFRIRATIVNAASARRDKQDALLKYGLPALQKAFDAEAASMRQYMADKLKRSAQRLGIRTR